ncbi:MAG: TIGR01777 family oxidoreductase [Lunatimonas sp.]|uniref:TIGR01777 family oxidoreductase n=1 Tax=Lunatimonas sp. TaxID=2060141 RepID=UPI00263BC8C8|nr:TIGR01777 family oxidoreductase [Lunatimonas sp.]MCC5937587.1 TIGR01777 family oxidoreductase [Lunatimonas sp.]
MNRILITGGSGLVGGEITRLLEQEGKEVAWLSRSPNENSQKSFFWDIEKQELDADALTWCDGIIHLAGTGVAEKRWTAERKRQILQSRILSTLLLYDSLEKLASKPKAFISASAVGYYGFDTGEVLQREDSLPGMDFLASVVKKWEGETEKIATLGIRTAILRIGIVLAKGGGALPEMLKPPVAAPLGHGRQYLSWIHVRDLARMFLHALEHSHVQGVFNAVGPHPATNAALTKAAAKAAGKPFVPIGVPGFALKLVLGEMAQMVLGGNKVSSAKIEATGFAYTYADLPSALAAIYRE